MFFFLAVCSSRYSRVYSYVHTYYSVHPWLIIFRYHRPTYVCPLSENISPLCKSCIDTFELLLNYHHQHCILSHAFPSFFQKLAELGENMFAEVSAPTTCCQVRMLIKLTIEMLAATLVGVDS